MHKTTSHATSHKPAPPPAAKQEPVKETAPKKTAYEWAPQPSINAYELAQAVPVLIKGSLQKDVEALDEGARQHFKEKDSNGTH